MKIDAAAAYRCWAVDVELADRTWRIPALPAADWLDALNGTWLDVVPGLVDDPAGDLDDLLVDGTVDRAAREAAARDAVAAAAGMPWWTASRLAVTLNQQWNSVGSELLLRGVDPGVRPLGAVLSATYWALARHLDAQKRAQLDIDLDRPPKGVPISEMYDRQAAGQAFMALAASGG